MLIVGILYVLLGILTLFASKNRGVGTVNRMSGLLVSTGLLISATSLFFVGKVETLICGILVIIFSLLSLLEVNKHYRKFRNYVDHMDKQK